MSAEISLEMNPGTVTKDKLTAYREAGINRLSIGLQSIHDEELRMLGRIHTYEEFLCAYRMARECGFDNINIDLISAIPEQTIGSWEETVRTIAELQPEHISAYSLIIEPGTPFYELYGEDAVHNKETQKNCKMLPGEEEEREMYHITKRILADAGYERYEISNYAKPGYECRHNCGYWMRVPYLGFGVGASSFVRGLRYTNPENVGEYSKCFGDKFNAEKLSREEEMEEFMFLGLRMMIGISKQEFERNFDITIEEIYGNQIQKLESLQLLDERDDRIFLTEKGIDVSNSVFVEFLF